MTAQVKKGKRRMIRPGILPIPRFIVVGLPMIPPHPVVRCGPQGMGHFPAGELSNPGQGRWDWLPPQETQLRPLPCYKPPRTNSAQQQEAEVSIASIE